jgi:RNA polymerase sigma-70 factor (ECF subfamily)
LVGQIPYLRRYAWALVGDRTRADDLVQDCLERAWSRSHLFRPEEDIRVWLFTILHNLYVDEVRRQSRQPVLMPLTDQVECLSFRATQEGGPEIADLGRALAQLPAEQSAAVLLVGLEDMTYREAAAVLGIPEGTLMSRLHRGRKRLRDLMAGDAPARLRRVK